MMRTAPMAPLSMRSLARAARVMPIHEAFRKQYTSLRACSSAGDGFLRNVGQWLLAEHVQTGSGRPLHPESVQIVR